MYSLLFYWEEAHHGFEVICTVCHPALKNIGVCFQLLELVTHPSTFYTLVYVNVYITILHDISYILTWVSLDSLELVAPNLPSSCPFSIFNILSDWIRYCSWIHWKGMILSCSSRFADVKLFRMSQIRIYLKTARYFGSILWRTHVPLVWYSAKNFLNIKFDLGDFDLEVLLEHNRSGRLLTLVLDWRPFDRTSPRWKN